MGQSMQSMQILLAKSQLPITKILLTQLRTMPLMKYRKFSAIQQVDLPIYCGVEEYMMHLTYMDINFGMNVNHGIMECDQMGFQINIIMVERVLKVFAISVAIQLHLMECFVIEDFLIVQEVRQVLFIHMERIQRKILLVCCFRMELENGCCTTIMWMFMLLLMNQMKEIVSLTLIYNVLMIQV